MFILIKIGKEQECARKRKGVGREDIRLARRAGSVGEKKIW